GHWSLVIGHWSLVIGHWSLVIGHWSLVIGHWILVHTSPLVGGKTLSFMGLIQAMLKSGPVYFGLMTND
ncbi:MAG: hypothetical protein V7L23_06290, partial [Nostoc sp.]